MNLHAILNSSPFGKSLFSLYEIPYLAVLIFITINNGRMHYLLRLFQFNVELINLLSLNSAIFLIYSLLLNVI